MLAELVVGLPLRLTEFDKQGLLSFFRQVGEHLRLCPSQQVGADGAGHDVGAAPAVGEELPQPGGAAKLAGVQKLEDAPQLADVVFDGRARERQPMPRPEEPAGLGRLAGGVFDRLRLVEHHVIKLGLTVGEDVAPQRAVGRDHDVPVGERAGLVHPRGAGVVYHPEARCELPRLLDPVEDETAGHDHKRRAARQAGRLRLLLPPREERQHLDRLAEAHVVGEAAAEAELLQEHQPAEAFPLVLAERALKARGLGLGFRLLARRELLPQPVERLVDRRLRLAGEERVEQRHLDPAVPQLAVVFVGQGRHRLKLPRETVGQDPDRAIGKLDRTAAFGDRLEQRGEFGRDATEVDGRREFEPVDAAGHVPGHAASRAIATPRNFDHPPRGRQL